MHHSIRKPGLAAAIAVMLVHASAHAGEFNATQSGGGMSYSADHSHIEVSFSDIFSAPPTFTAAGEASVGARATDAFATPQPLAKYTLNPPQGTSYSDIAQVFFNGIKASAFASLDTVAQFTDFPSSDGALFHYFSGIDIDTTVTADVIPVDPQGRMSGHAHAELHDPFSVTGLANDDALHMRQTLHAGLAVAAGGVGARGEYRIEVGTSLDGFSTLFSLDLLSNGSAGTPTLGIALDAHPLLAIDTTSLHQQLADAFVYDSVRQLFRLDHDVELYSVDVALPGSVPFDLGMNVVADAVRPVPIPAALATMASCVVVLGTRSRSRRSGRARTRVTRRG